MTKSSFMCPKCRKEALSVEDYESIAEEGKLDPKQIEWLRTIFPIEKTKKYRFWRCPDCDGELYYQTDLEGSLIAELRLPKLKQAKI